MDIKDKGSLLSIIHELEKLKYRVEHPSEKVVKKLHSKIRKHVKKIEVKDDEKKKSIFERIFKKSK